MKYLNYNTNEKQAINSMKSTLNKIRKNNPCKESWLKLLEHLDKTEADDKDLHLSVILDLLGVQDTIWALRAVDGKEKEIRLFACDCAEHVLHIYEAKNPNDPTVRKCIEVARRYAAGEATSEEMTAAWDAADAAARDADTARAAANAAAWAAARTADWDAERNYQEFLIRKLIEGENENR